MTSEESNTRRKKLTGILYEISKAPKGEIDIIPDAKKLNEVYSDGFRHAYSDLYFVIMTVMFGENGYDATYLATNLEILSSIVDNDEKSEEKQYENLYKPLPKLIDHITMEISRNSNSFLKEQKLNELEKRNENLQGKLDEAIKSIDTANKETESLKTEIISILSIFAAIVLAFSGSISLLGSALVGMKDAPFFKSVFFILLCGFVISNTIFVLLYFVAKITGRNIYARCKSDDCTCMPKCKSIKRLCNRLPYVFWLNFAMLASMILDLIIWGIVSL